TRTKKAQHSVDQWSSTTLYTHSCIMFALICALFLPSPAVAESGATPTPSCSPTPAPSCTCPPSPTPVPDVADSSPSPNQIRALAADAYKWGLGPEFIERFSIYNTIISQPFNKLVYGSVPAAWNNQATQAGDASVVYISGFVRFDEQPELVLTVP